GDRREVFILGQPVAVDAPPSPAGGERRAGVLEQLVRVVDQRQAERLAAVAIVVAPRQLRPAAAAVAPAIARGLAAVAVAIRIDAIGDLLRRVGEVLGVGEIRKPPRPYLAEAHR